MKKRTMETIRNAVYVSHICPYLASDHSPSVSVNHESAEHNQSVADQTLHRQIPYCRS